MILEKIRIVVAFLFFIRQKAKEVKLEKINQEAQDKQ